MNIKRTLKIVVVVICNPHRVLLYLSAVAVTAFDWLLDKLQDLSRMFRNWLEVKAESSPIFAKSISDSLIKESEDLQKNIDLRSKT